MTAPHDIRTAAPTHGSRAVRTAVLTGGHPQVWAYSNLKGGVGKTTSAVYSGAALVWLGRDAVVVDASPQGSATKWQASVEDRSSWPVPVVSAPRQRLGWTLQQLRREHEIVIVDCPPELVDVVREVVEVADLVVIPVAPSMMELDQLVPTLTVARDARVETVQTFLTRVRAGTRMRRTGREWLERNGVPCCGTEIPWREHHNQHLGAPPRRGTAYEDLVAELLACRV